MLHLLAMCSGWKSQVTANYMGLSLAAYFERAYRFREEDEETISTSADPLIGAIRKMTRPEAVVQTTLWYCAPPHPIGLSVWLYRINDSVV
jgi:hypothetical protein